MTSDHRLLMGMKGLPDFIQAEKEFLLKKKANSAPAALQIADAYAEARAAGDTQRMNDIAIAAKSFDRGVVYDQNGNPVAMGGYGDAVGSIAGTRKAYEANAQNASDLAYDPLIAGGEARQRQSAELDYANPIAQNRKAGEISATQMGDLMKKVDSAGNTMGLTDQARQILEAGKATGSIIGTGVNLGKRLVGVSDENTQANTALEVIAGNLTGNVPRFEGPQSDADRAYYMQMAGRVDDTTRPAADRLAALAEIDKLNQKYSNIQTPTKEMLGIPAMSAQEFNTPVAPIDIPTPSNPMTQSQAPQKGMVVDGYMFNGGDPSKQSSWKKVK